MNSMDLDDLLSLGTLSSPPMSHTGARSAPQTPPSQAPAALPLQYIPPGAIPKTPTKKQHPGTVFLGSPITSQRVPGHESSPLSYLGSSPPIVGTAKEKVALRQAQANKKRARTIAQKKAEDERKVADQLARERLEADIALARAQLHEAAQDAAQAARGRAGQSEVFNEVLALLDSHHLTWGDFVLYMSGRRAGQKRERYIGFFAAPKLVHRVLDLWASSQNSETGRKTVHEWTLKYTEKLVSREAAKVTEGGMLRSSRKQINPQFALGFDLSELAHQVIIMCPSMTRIVRAFSTTPRQVRELTAQSRHKKEMRIGTSMLTLLGEQSQRNSYVKHVLGLYLYACGAQRQVVSILAKLGICSSYSTIVGNEATKVAEKRTTGRTNSFLAKLLGVTDADSDTGESESDESDDESVLDSSSSDSEYIPLDSDLILSSEPGFDKSSDSGMETEPLESDCGHGLGRELQDVERSFIERQKERLKNGMMNREDEDAPTTLPTCGRGAGLLKRLSLAHRLQVRKLARTFELGHCYDNYNVVYKVSEQIVGRKDSQENGTCATVFPLFDAHADNMRTADLISSLDNAPPLSISDVCLSHDENEMLNKYLQHTILRIIVLHGGPGFQRFRDDVFKCTPQTSQRIPVHKTDIYPLPAMNIDESSTAGNADVVDTVYREVGHHLDSPLHWQTVRIIFGDQLSVSRHRGSTANRTGHDNPLRTHINTVEAPGLFHYLMTTASGTLETHWGDPSSGARNPGSLCFHNNVLDKKPLTVTGSSPPPYRVSRDLIFVSLYGRILHCLELVTKCTSLDEYAKNVTFDELQQHAAEILKQYASPAVAAKLRGERAKAEEQGNSCPKGDMVFENGVLFNRDALLLRAFTDVIKDGDSGFIIILLKVYALAYRGMNRPKYAFETMLQIHNLLHVWPKALRDIIIKNWLVNPTGRARGFIPVDLMQEHLIFWIKVIYSAQGSNATAEWLENISPCIDILRQLATSLNDSLGSKNGNKHTSPDISNDIREVVKSLRTHRVYVVEEGRKIDSKKAEVPNIVTEGIHQLQNPLRNYNTAFDRLRLRRRMNPLIGKPIVCTTHSGTAAPMFSAFSNPSDSNILPCRGDYSGDSSSDNDNDEGLEEDENNGDEEGDEDEDEDEDAADDEFEGVFGFDAAELLLSLETEEDVDLDLD